MIFVRCSTLCKIPDRVRCFGDPNAQDWVLQAVGSHESATLQQEYDTAAALLQKPFYLIAVSVSDWNADLAPWDAPPVFGDEAFGHGAADTLQYIIHTILPALQPVDKRLYIVGYSLSGLFALWAATQCSLFTGTAGVSPSVWFPGWLSYVAEHPLQANICYCSLGDKEEKTRHPVMRTVGSCIRSMDAIAAELCAWHTLEWNPGNHFRDPQIRVAKGIAWMLSPERRLHGTVSPQENCTP